MRSVFVVLSLVASLLFGGCAGSQHPVPVAEFANVAAPQTLELQSDAHASMLRFPAGVYTLRSTDQIGYYYRSPRGVRAHGVVREGGIFVSKRDQRKLRGYVYLAGGVTHVGNLSGVPHTFR
jgi:hypothetical protein